MARLCLQLLRKVLKLLAKQMNIETALLNRLKSGQADYALLSLKHPSAKSEFEYGFRSGTVAGLEQAINLLLQLVGEERNGEKDLDRTL